MRTVRISNYDFPVWIIIIAITAAVSVTIWSSDLMGSNVDAALVEDDVPRTRLNIWPRTPVHFDKEHPSLTVSGNGAEVGAHVVTNQQLRIDLLAQVADPVSVTIPIRNESEDPRTIMIRVITDPKVMVDVEEGFNTRETRLVGTNQWVMTVDGNMDADFKLEIIALRGGAFFLLVEMLSVV